MAKTVFLNQDDFKSAQIELHIENLVSGTVVDSKQVKIGNWVRESGPSSTTSAPCIELLEFITNGLVLSVPHAICSIGHSLSLSLRVLNLSKQPMDIVLQGKVTQIESTPDQQDRISLKLNNPTDPRWESLHALWDSRQTSINEFLRTVKGLG